MDIRGQYEFWKEASCFDEETKAELRKIEGDEKEIQERFYKDLEFGTAGLRGIIGAGSNRINRYTIRRATQGLANYIKKCGDRNKKVVIAYDSRHFSEEFAKEAALCLAANGIKAYMFESLRPTPELSFAVRHLHCIAGINITASHNPPEYNGYKVYWEDGAQITPPHDQGIMAEVKKITDFSLIPIISEETALQKGLYEIIGTEVDAAYIEALKKQVLHPEAIQRMGKQLKIVYTPLHGAGNRMVRRILQELGFENVHVVCEQELPDGAFPTVSYPNPETEEAFVLALDLAKKIDADLVLATDPDADRLGVYVKDDKTGEYHALTGNMSGCLLAEYELGQRQDLQGLPADGQLIKTIVSSNMAGAIAREYGIKLVEVLTGFKYIGQKILQMEQTGEGTYLFGFEESYGCLIGTHARDKDAVMAVAALCEAAAYYRQAGKSLWNAMTELYEKYGYYREAVHNISLEGKEGLEKIQAMLVSLRENPPQSIGGVRIVKIRDYQEGMIREVKTGAVTPTKQPRSNVLYYELEEEGWVCVRASGTEPKLKFYCGIRGNSALQAEKLVVDLGESIMKLAVSME